MKKNSVLYEQIKSDLSGSLNGSSTPAEFFQKIKKEYEKEELAEICNEILENCKDLNFLSQTMKEIDKLRDEINLNGLIDFIMTKTPQDFGISDVNTHSLGSDFINLRVLCVKVISNFKDKSAVPTLLYCLNSKGEHYKFRLAIAEALGKIGDTNAVESLIGVVSDEAEKSVYVRESAAKALGMIGDMRAMEAFLGILEAKKSFLDKFTFLKERVIEAMGNMEISGNKRAFLALTNALGDDSPQIRTNAIESLSNSDFDEADELIEKMVFDTDRDVSESAVVALYNMSGKQRIIQLLEGKDLPNHIQDCAFALLEEDDEDE